MNIGDFAAATGLSVSAVRFYGGRGLLPPADIDKTSGYRSYDNDQIATGRLIRDLRRMDMPLAAIEQALILPAHKRQRLVEAHVAELEQVLRRAKGLASQLNDQPLPEEDHMSKDSATTDVSSSSAVVEATEFARALDQVLPASGEDPHRPHLMGILLEGREGSLRIVATDSHRCVVRDLVPVELTSDFGAIVAAATLRRWRSQLTDEGSLRLTVDDRAVHIKTDLLTLSAERIPSTFPPYESVLHPTNEVLTITTARHELLTALESFDEHAVLTMDLDGPDLSLGDGTTQRHLAADIPTSGLSTGIRAGIKAGIKVGINATFAADAVRHAMGAEVFIEIEDTLRPLVFRSADDGTYTSLLMPVKL